MSAPEGYYTQVVDAEDFDRYTDDERPEGCVRGGCNA